MRLDDFNVSSIKTANIRFEGRDQGEMTVHLKGKMLAQLITLFSLNP